MPGSLVAGLGAEIVGALWLVTGCVSVGGGSQPAGTMSTKHNASVFEIFIRLSFLLVEIKLTAGQSALLRRYEFQRRHLYG